MTDLAPDSIEEIREVVCGHDRIVVRGAGTKQMFGAETSAATVLDLRKLSGILEYNPGEFTFTALAGTPLREIEKELRANGQHLPCDPPLQESGATLGGALASGLNGPGRLRYGGWRDFVLGVTLVDGEGRLLHGGGKVVKNAAGFDLPKLMTGSMGRLGVIVAATLKVFPRPREWRTLRIGCLGINDAVETMLKLCALPLDLEAVDLIPPGEILVRISGAGKPLVAHAEKIASLNPHPCKHLANEEEAGIWRSHREFSWAGDLLIKIPIVPRDISILEGGFVSASFSPTRRYSVAGNVVWISWPRDRPLGELRMGTLSGLVARGGFMANYPLRVGPLAAGAGAVASRIKFVLDPTNRFPALI